MTRSQQILFRCDTHIKSILRLGWGWGVRTKIRYHRMYGGAGWGASTLHVQSLFFNKENWICALTKHHPESNINI